MKRAPCAAAARTVAVTLLLSAVRPGSNGATSTPQCTPADTSCSITRSRCAGAGVPGSVRSQISRSTVGTLKQTVRARAPAERLQDVGVPHDQGPLGHDRDRRAEAREIAPSSAA